MCVSCVCAMNRTRELFIDYDFHGLPPPQSEADISQYSLFKWLARAPGAIQSCGKVLDLMVPLCVILNSVDAAPDKWEKSLLNYKTNIANYEESREQLRLLLTQLGTVRKIWEEKKK